MVHTEMLERQTKGLGSGPIYQTKQGFPRSLMYALLLDTVYVITEGPFGDMPRDADGRSKEMLGTWS